MNQTIKQVLSGKADNHILPFFWQHGEAEWADKDAMPLKAPAGPV